MLRLVEGTGVVTWMECCPEEGGVVYLCKPTNCLKCKELLCRCQGGVVQALDVNFCIFHNSNKIPSRVVEAKKHDAFGVTPDPLFSEKMQQIFFET